MSNRTIRAVPWIIAPGGRTAPQATVQKPAGYRAIEDVGIWTVSFEHSGFCPQSQPAQTWCLSYFGDTRSDLPKDLKIPAYGVHIRVTGYLSSSGQFGHLNRYDHEFFVTSIAKDDDYQ